MRLSFFFILFCILICNVACDLTAQSHSDQISGDQALTKNASLFHAYNMFGDYSMNGPILFITEGHPGQCFGHFVVKVSTYNIYIYKYWNCYGEPYGRTGVSLSFKATIKGNQIISNGDESWTGGTDNKQSPKRGTAIGTFSDHEFHIHYVGDRENEYDFHGVLTSTDLEYHDTVSESGAIYPKFESKFTLPISDFNDDVQTIPPEVAECGQKQNTIARRARECAHLRGSLRRSKSGVEWSLVSRRSVAFENHPIDYEVWQDLKSGLLWGDVNREHWVQDETKKSKLSGWNYQDALNVACSSRYNDYYAGIKEVGFSLPTFNEYKSALDDGMNEIVSNYEGLFRTSTLVPISDDHVPGTNVWENHWIIDVFRGEIRFMNDQHDAKESRINNFMVRCVAGR